MHRHVWKARVCSLCTENEIWVGRITVLIGTRINRDGYCYTEVITYLYVMVSLKLMGKRIIRSH